MKRLVLLLAIFIAGCTLGAEEAPNIEATIEAGIQAGLRATAEALPDLTLTAEPTPTAQPDLAPKPVEMFEVARWEGKATKNTETFHISSRQWRISWTTRPGEFGAMNFQIYVYKEGSVLPNVAANVIGTDSDSTIMRGAGDYYLTINTGQPYVIVVEALK